MILLELFVTFGILSLVAFGGIPNVIAEMQRSVVDERGWTSAVEFMQFFALTQAVPGPPVLIVSLVGWKVAGLAGAVVALVATCAPPALLAWWTSGMWERYSASPWRLAMKSTIAPLSVGLTLAGGYVLCTSGAPDWRLWVVAAASGVVVLIHNVNPIWILALAGLSGAALF